MAYAQNQPQSRKQIKKLPHTKTESMQFLNRAAHTTQKQGQNN